MMASSSWPSLREDAVNTPSKSVNAWILPSEDDPEGTNYKSPDSSYQSLIAYGVYNHVDMLNICFLNTVPTSSSTVPTGDGSTYTIDLQTADHPDGYTNQQYMDWVIQDARKANPEIKILVTLGYADDEFTQIFQGPSSGWQQAATAYGQNLVAYLQHYGLDGFDIDWEGDFASATTKEQFKILLTAVRAAFDAQDKYYYLTLSPAVVGTLDAPTANNAFDFINLQVYGNSLVREEFIQAGVVPGLLAYGAKFESEGGGDKTPHQDAQDAYSDMVDGQYGIATQWRLNSGNFQYEQAQQMILYELVYGLPGDFDDTPIIGAAGNPPITELVVRSGDVLDAVQSTSTGSYDGIPVQYHLLQHGGSSGSPSSVTIPSGDLVVEVSGYTGTWFGWECLLQITLRTRNGTTFGPFGTMNNASSKTPFTYTAPQGKSIVAFSGSTVEVPLAGGGTTYVVASLAASYA
jgi:Glycosyl hydrolases family 18